MPSFCSDKRPFYPIKLFNKLWTNLFTFIKSTASSYAFIRAVSSQMSSSISSSWKKKTNSHSCVIFVLNNAVNNCKYTNIIYFDAFHWHQTICSLYCSVHRLYLLCTRKTKDDQQFTNGFQQSKCSIRSLKFKIVLYNVYQLKHKNYAIYKTHAIKHYHVFYATQWTFIILNYLSHMTDDKYFTKTNERVLLTQSRHFHHFLLWGNEFDFDVLVNLDLKKISIYTHL